MIARISNMLANVGKNGLHCVQNEDFAGWFVRGGTINSQIVKQEGEYTPEVPDTVTHVPPRTVVVVVVVPSLKFYRGTNPTKTIIKLCTLQPLSSGKPSARDPARNRTEKQV